MIRRRLRKENNPVDKVGCANRPTECDAWQGPPGDQPISRSARGISHINVEAA